MTVLQSARNQWNSIDPALKKTGLFFGKLALIYLSWKVWIFGIVGKEEWDKNTMPWPWLGVQWERFNDWVRIGLLESSNWALGVFGFESGVRNNYICYIDGYGGVSVGNYCLGMQLIYYYIGLLIISPISFRLKLVAVPVALLINHALNTARITALNIMTVHLPEYVDVSHHYLFNALVFGCLVLFLMLLFKVDQRNKLAAKG